MSEVIFKIEREDGELFIIDDTEWRIPNDGLSGWHTTNSNISMFENTYSDGSIITQQRVPAVDRTITAEARDSSASNMLRTVAERFFVPHKTYYVYATYMGRTRKFEGVQAAFTLSEGNIHKPITLVWTITCPSPYSSDSEQSVGKSPYSILSHGSGMPYMVFIQDHDGYRKGFVTGVIRSAPEPGYGMDKDNILMLTNNGDVRTRPVFYAKVQKLRTNASLKVKISRLSEYETDDGTRKFSEDYMSKLELNNIQWTYGGEDPAEDYARNVTDYLKIDVSARPFTVKAISVSNITGGVVYEEPVRFDMGADYLIRNPYIDQGDNYFLFDVKLMDGSAYAENQDVEIYATADNLYTGV